MIILAFKNISVELQGVNHSRVQPAFQYQASLFNKQQGNLEKLF